MNYITELSEKNIKRAHEIINELKITELWNNYGAKANLIGSVATGLLMKHKDIDFHIYSNQFSIADSFAAVSGLAKNNRIKRINYENRLDTDEMCIEWHAWYQDVDNEEWQIDMIHIMNESPYAGKMEKVAERINEILTPEIKYAILSIKNEIPESMKVMGIEVYLAVIRDRINNYKDFIVWRKKQQLDSIIDWIP